MLDYKEHCGLNWAQTIELFEKKELNVAAEITWVIVRNIEPRNIGYYINQLCELVPGVSKYKEDIEKYLLLM